MKPVKVACVGLFVLLAAACATATGPEVTYDGLELVPDAQFGGQVYRLPGADLGVYDAIGLVDCDVAFRKNWLRDQNRHSIDLGSRVTQEDVDRIRDTLREECGKTFRGALLEAPAYTLVEEFSAGEQVLILRPRIINLDVTAPDVRSAGMSRTYTTSAGQMTLYLEALDGTTGQVLARAIDRQRARESFRMELSSSVSNRAEARRILNGWSRRLREALDVLVDSEDRGAGR